MKYVQYITLYLFISYTLFASEYKIVDVKDEYIKVIAKSNSLKIDKITLESNENNYTYKYKIISDDANILFLRYEDFENFKLENKSETLNKLIINYTKNNKAKEDRLKINSQLSNELKLTTKHNNNSNNKSSQCTGITLEGKRCKRRTNSADGKCWQHKNNNE